MIIVILSEEDLMNGFLERLPHKDERFIPVHERITTNDERIALRGERIFHMHERITFIDERFPYISERIFVVRERISPTTMSA